MLLPSSLRSWVSVSLLLSIPVLGLAAKPVVVSNFAKPIIISADSPMVTVQLPANLTTGYHWYLASYDNSQIQPSGYRYLEPSTKLMGSPGEAQFTLKLLGDAFVVPKLLHVTFVYQRPWESQPGRQQRITLMTAASASAQ